MAIQFVLQQQQKADNINSTPNRINQLCSFSKNFVVMQFLFKKSNTRQLTWSKRHQRVCIKTKEE